jgi:hypothetical protein
MDERRTLIEKLSRELEAMTELIDATYTLESPEVQEIPLLGLHLNIGETRLICEALEKFRPADGRRRA